VNRHSIIPLIVAVLALAACTVDALFSSFQPISGEGWLRTDTIRFYTSPIPADGLYSEELGLRTNSRYPFMQLSMIVNQQTRPSRIDRTDTIVVSLTDNEGIVQGEGICHYIYSIPLQAVQLNKGDTLLVSVHHNMIRQQLEGVTDVGFTLLPH
jgi:gliding motility-associated lipoprotein GldH